MARLGDNKRLKFSDGDADKAKKFIEIRLAPDKVGVVVIGFGDLVKLLRLVRRFKQLPTETKRDRAIPIAMEKQNGRVELGYLINRAKFVFHDEVDRQKSEHDFCHIFSLVRDRN